MIFFFLFPGSSSSFSEEMYRWTDERGVVHVTDDASKIPQKYLDKQETIKTHVEPRSVNEKAGPAGENAIPRTGVAEQKPDPAKKYLENVERKIEEKKRLEKRVAQLEKELARAEERLRGVQEDQRMGRLYGARSQDEKENRRLAREASDYYAPRKRELEDRITRIRKEIELLQEKISTISRSL
jgi:hypothetical protein